MKYERPYMEIKITNDVRTSSPLGMSDNENEGGSESGLPIDATSITEI